MDQKTLPPYTPPYTPSLPLPQYSLELLPGEQTVEFSHRASSPAHTGVYRRITDNLTIILRNQLPGSVYPVYGRGGIIKGDVRLGGVVDLMSVVLKIEGQFLLHDSEGSVSRVFFSQTYVLWSASDAQRCPLTIPFAVVLPLSFEDGGQLRALPPSLDSTEPHAACSYSMAIELSRPRQFPYFFKGSEAVKVPFVYRPRCRPHLPVLPSDLPFMSTVKSSPEEWHEVICALPMTQGSGLADAECLLFIPSVQTYAFSDTIPFHLQIRGSPASLIPFLEQGRDSFQGANGGVIIRVYLQQQITVRIHGRSATTYRILGEGKMQPSHLSPSEHDKFMRHPLGPGLDSLDWDGALRCEEDVNVSGFFTSQFSIKDSIVLSITPRQPLKSPLLGTKYSCPIRLVTDPYQSVQ